MKKRNEKDKFFTDRDKTLFSFFLFVFVFFVLLINWNDIHPFLNPRTGPTLVRQKINNFVSGEPFLGDKEKEIFEESLFCDENSINISSIFINVPVVETQNTTERGYREALDKGVVRFPGSVYPGDDGLLILLGHSAPEGWPKVNHDWVFTEIEKLKEGDEIVVCYNGLSYTYTVIDEDIGKKIYSVGDDVPPLYPEEKKKELVLMTCWPPGDSSNRIGIRAVMNDID